MNGKAFRRAEPLSTHRALRATHQSGIESTSNRMMEQRVGRPQLRRLEEHRAGGDDTGPRTAIRWRVR